MKFGSRTGLRPFTKKREESPFVIDNVPAQAVSYATEGRGNYMPGFVVVGTIES